MQEDLSLCKKKNSQIAFDLFFFILLTEMTIC